LLFLFQLCGLLLISFAVWMWIDPTFSISMAQDEASYYTGVYLILFVGALLLIVGFLGCAAAISESQCSLVLVMQTNFNCLFMLFKNINLIFIYSIFVYY